MSRAQYFVDSVGYGKNCDRCRSKTKAPCPSAGEPLTQCAQCTKAGEDCVWTPAAQQGGGSKHNKGGSQAVRQPPLVNHGVQGNDEELPILPKARNKGRGVQKKPKKKEEENEEDSAQSSDMSEPEEGEYRAGPSKPTKADKHIGEPKLDNSRPSRETKSKQPFRESAHIRPKQDLAGTPKSSLSSLPDASPARSALALKPEESFPHPSSSDPRDQSTAGPSKHDKARSTETVKEKQKEKKPFKESSHIRSRQDPAVPPESLPARPSDQPPSISSQPITTDSGHRDQSTAGPSKQDKKRDTAGSGFKKVRRIVDSDDEDEGDSGRASQEGGEGSEPKVEGGGSGGSGSGIMLRIPSQQGASGSGTDTARMEEAGSSEGPSIDQQPARTGDIPRPPSPGSKKRKRKEQQRLELTNRIAEGQDGESAKSGASEDGETGHLRKKLKMKKADRIAALKPSASGTGVASGSGLAGPSTPVHSGPSSPAPGTPDSQRDPNAMDIDKPAPSSTVKSVVGTSASGTPGPQKEVRQRIPKKGMQAKTGADDMLTALFKTRTGGTTSGASTPNRALGKASDEHTFAATQRQAQAKLRAKIMANQVTLDLMGSGSAIKRFESNPLNFPSRSTIYNPTEAPVDVARQSNGYSSYGARTYPSSEGLPYDDPPPPPPPSASVKLPKSVEAVRRLLAMRDNGLLGV